MHGTASYHIEIYYASGLYLCYQRKKDYVTQIVFVLILCR